MITKRQGWMGVSFMTTKYVDLLLELLKLSVSISVNSGAVTLLT